MGPIKCLHRGSRVDALKSNDGVDWQRFCSLVFPFDFLSFFLYSPRAFFYFLAFRVPSSTGFAPFGIVLSGRIAEARKRGKRSDVFASGII